jgi:FtsH-binding integral membrane protein
VNQRRAGITRVALLAFAGYGLFLVIVAIAGEGHGSVFWTSINVIVVLAATALWVARRLSKAR